MLTLLNRLGKVDLIFFISVGVALLIAVLVYFLYPLIFAKKFKQQREDLRRREAAFKANRESSEAPAVEEETVEPQNEE